MREQLTIEEPEQEQVVLLHESANDFGEPRKDEPLVETSFVTFFFDNKGWISIAVTTFLLVIAGAPSIVSQNCFPTDEDQPPVCFKDPSDWKHSVLKSTQKSCLQQCILNRDVFSGSCSKSTACSETTSSAETALPVPSYVAAQETGKFRIAWEGMMETLSSSLIENLGNDDLNKIEKALPHIAIQHFCCTPNMAENDEKAFKRAFKLHNWPEINVTFSNQIGCVSFDENYQGPAHRRGQSFLALVPDDESQSALFQMVRDWEATLQRHLYHTPECRTHLFHATLAEVQIEDEHAEQLREELAKQWKSLNPGPITLRVQDFADSNSP